MYFMFSSQASLFNIIVALATIVILAIAIFIIRRHLIFNKYINRSGIPFLRVTSYISGSFHLLVTPKQSYAERLERYFNSEGDTYGFFVGEVPFVNTKDRDLIYKVWVQESHKHINRPYLGTMNEYDDVSLLQARDDVWRRTRRAIGSTMTLSKLKLANVERDIDECLEKMMFSLERRQKSNDCCDCLTVDCSSLFKTFIMDVFMNVGFDQANQIDYDNLNNNKIVTNAKNTVKKANNRVVIWMLYVHKFSIVVQWMIKLFNINHFVHYLDDKLEKIIDKMTTESNRAKKIHEQHTDKGNGEVASRKMIHSLLDLYKNKKLTKQELKSNTFFMLMAGWDTTSDSLTALCWQLANNSDVQHKLRNHIIKDGIDSKYLQYVIKESLRLMPPVATAREIAEEFHWKGFTLMKGMMLNMAVYSLGRDEKLWGADANEFKPERFYEEESHHGAQFVSFGLGPRNCVGYQLAMLEIKMVISRLLLKYEIRLNEDSPKKLMFKESKDTLWFVNILQDSVTLDFVLIK